MKDLTFRGVQQVVLFGKQLGLTIVISQKGNVQPRKRLGNFKTLIPNKMENLKIFKA